MPAGRPSLYDPEHCDTVITAGKTGASKAEMAYDLGVAYSTFDLWTHTHPEFSEAVKSAVQFSQGWWEKQGRLATFGAIDGYNPTSYIFQMKNRFRDDWRDVKANELTGANGGPIQTDNKTTEVRRTIVDPRHPDAA